MMQKRKQKKPRAATTISTNEANEFVESGEKPKSTRDDIDTVVAELDNLLRGEEGDLLLI